MKLTIITSLYRSDRYLRKFEASLLAFAQKLLSGGWDMECIVITNDATEAELGLGYRLRNHRWFKFQNVSRETLYATWNRGVQQSTGELITFWNADDQRTADAVFQAGSLFNSGAQIVYFPFTLVRYLTLAQLALPVFRKRVNPPAPTDPEFPHGMNFGPFFMFTKAAFQAIGPFDEQFYTSGDFDWNMRAVRSGLSVVLSRHLAGTFRIDRTGLSSGGSLLQKAENNIVISRYHLPLPLATVPRELSSRYNVSKVTVNGQEVPFDRYFPAHPKNPVT